MVAADWSGGWSSGDFLATGVAFWGQRREVGLVPRFGGDTAGLHGQRIVLREGRRHVDDGTSEKLACVKG